MTKKRRKKKDTKELFLQNFSKYIKAMREEKNISQDDLCRGICSSQQLSLVESGVNMPDSLLQDALLERLGVGAEDNERYLSIFDYERWLAQMELFNHIIYERWDVALECLVKYQQRKEYNPKNKFEYQFVLAMKGQIRYNQGADSEELRAIYGEAIQLTVPEVGDASIDSLVLSLKELNLLLEYERNRVDEGRENRYLEIMAYTEKNCDALGIAKIYPKAVYLLCKCSNQLTPKEELHYCMKAVEYLRDTSRIYYMWEILKLRNELIQIMLSNMKWEAKSTQRELNELLEQNHSWKDALEYFYDKFHVRRETFEYCYLYVIKGVTCVNDVIRIRREMLGISHKELCGGCGDVRTLRRLESKQTSPQWSTVAELLPKLGLPAEYSRNTIITDNNYVKQAVVRIMRCANAQKWIEADEILKSVRNEIPRDDKYNLQLLMQKEAQIKWNLGEIDKEEYCKKVKEALEITLPFEVFIEDGRKYLTHQEQTCIMNLMKTMDKKNEKYWVCAERFEEYYKEYEENGLLYSVDGMYAYIVSVIASELGNCGRFSESDKHNENIAEGYLRLRKMRVLSMALYGNWWNYMERIKDGIPVDKIIDAREELTQIIQLANLDNQRSREKHYLNKLKSI